MLSQNVVLFCQKETTGKKNTSYAVLKGHFWITKKGQHFWTASSCPFLPNFVTGLGCPKVLSFFTADLKFPGNFATTDEKHTTHKKRDAEEADKVEVAPGVTVASLRRFRTALIGPTQGLPKRRRLCH